MDKRPRQFYEFGTFRVDAAERRLYRGEKFIPLPPKAFDVLLALVQNSGRLLTREELLNTVWNETFVDENNLRQYVSLLRKTLNSDDEEFIETVPRSGYRFSADVSNIVEDSYFPPKAVHRKYFYIALAAAVLLGLIGFAVSKMQKTENFSPQMCGTKNAEAYESYVQGRALWQTRSGENLHKAMLLLESAVQKDPNFALAHAALADCYAFDFANWKKAEPQAREAMRLDANLGEPHATIGFVRMFWEWKLAEAENEFKEALRLNPNYATAHQWYSVYLASRGNGDAAFAEIKTALELAPDSPSVNADLCQIFYFWKKYDEAIAQCRKTLEIDAGFFNAHLYLYEIYTAKGMYAEAVETYFEIRKMRDADSPSDNLKNLRESYEKGGIRQFWQMQIETNSRPAPQYYKLAQYQARLGENEKALRSLQKASEVRDFDFIFFGVDPVFENLFTDPRFRELDNKFFSSAIK